MPHDVGYSDPATAQPNAPAPRGPAPAVAPPGLSSAPDLWALLAALRRRWIAAILLGGTLAVIAAFSAFTFLAPQATAYTKIKVGFFDPSIWGNVTPPTDFKTFQRTTAAEISSRVVINEALKSEEVRRLNLEAQQTIDPAQFIEDGLRVEFAENSELVTILFSCGEPQQALVITNALRDAYFQRVLGTRRDERNRKVTELEKLYNETQESLKKKKESLQQLLTTLRDVDPVLWREHRQELIIRINHLQQQLARVTLEKIKGTDSLALLEARIEAAKARQEQKSAKKPVADESDTPQITDAELELYIDKALATDADAKALQAKLSRAEEIEDDYRRKGFHTNYFPRRNARALAADYKKQLDERRREVAAKVREARDNPSSPPVAPGTAGTTVASAAQESPEVFLPHLKRQIARLEAEEIRLQTDIDTLSKQASKAPTVAAEYDRAVGEIKRQEELIAGIYAKLEREKLERQAASRITGFGKAELMKADTRKQYVASAAAPLALFLAVCGGLAWLECRKQRVRGASEVSRCLGIRVVGAVPHQAGLEHQLVSPTGDCGLEGTPIMESIDAIRTRLLHEADTKSTRVVMITSAGAGEGKTTLAAALASSLARAGRKTLLLDGDLRRPAVHQLFELAPQPGFSEALLGEVELLEALQDTPLENLSVMVAGQWDREVLASLARGGLEGMFDKLAEEFDFILIDSHPVLEAADSLLIGRQADAVLLSVLNEVSQMPRVYAAQQQLASVGIRLMGAVVNAADPEDALTAPPAPVAVV